MKKMYIIFSKPKDHWFPIISWLIRLWYWTRYSHVCVEWESERLKKPIYYEAAGSCLHFLGRRRFDEKIKVVEKYSYFITEEQFTAVLDFCIDNAEMPYGKLSFIGIAWVDINKRLFGRKTRNPFADGIASQVCSEVMARILGKSMHLNFDVETASPYDINVMVRQDVRFTKEF